MLERNFYNWILVSLFPTFSLKQAKEGITGKKKIEKNAKKQVTWVSHCAIYRFINMDNRIRLGGGGGWFICLEIKIKFFEKGSRGTISHMHITRWAWRLFFGTPPSSHCMPPWVSTHFHNSQRLLCIYWSRVVQINPNQKECYCSSLACCALQFQIFNTIIR